MKKGKKSSLADYVDDPSELTGYFEEVAKGAYSDIDEAEVNLLALEESLQLTKEFPASIQWLNFSAELCWITQTRVITTSI